MLLVSEVYRTTENEPVFEDRFRIDYEMFSIVFCSFARGKTLDLATQQSHYVPYILCLMRLGKSIGVGKINCMIGWIDVRCMISTYTQLVINFQVSTEKRQDKPTHRSLSAELQGSRRSSPSISRASHGGALMQLTKGDADDARIHRFIWASPRNCAICRLQWRGIVVFSWLSVKDSAFHFQSLDEAAARIQAGVDSLEDYSGRVWQISDFHRKPRIDFFEPVTGTAKNLVPRNRPFQ